MRRLCSTGELSSFRTPGGQVRVWRAQLNVYRLGFSKSTVSSRGSSPALDDKREALHDLALELRERRLRRDLKKLEDEDAEVERTLSEAAKAEQLRNALALEQSRLQR